MSEKDEISSLSGEISAKDGLHWVLSGGKLWRAASISAMAVFFILLLIVFLEHKTVPKFAIFKLLQTSLTIFILISLSSLICSVGIYFFLKPNQRHVAWIFSAESFTLKDKAGNQITTPWTQVKAVKFNSKGVCIYCKPFGSRWVPNRLLPDAKIVDLKNLLKSVGVLV